MQVTIIKMRKALLALYILPCEQPCNTCLIQVNCIALRDSKTVRPKVQLDLLQIMLSAIRRLHNFPGSVPLPHGLGPNAWRLHMIKLLMGKSARTITHISPGERGVKLMKYMWNKVSMHELHTIRERIYLSQTPPYNFKDSSCIKNVSGQ